MKQLVYVIVQSVKAGNDEERKSIYRVFVFKHQAQECMDKLVVEFEDKQDAEGNFLWECERPWWSIANFKSNTHDMTFRLEVVEREIEL